MTLSILHAIQHLDKSRVFELMSALVQIGRVLGLKTTRTSVYTRIAVFSDFKSIDRLNKKIIKFYEIVLK